MPKIITRYFENPKNADNTRHELTQRRRVSGRILSLYHDADGLVDSLTMQGVDPKTAKAYEKRLRTGGAVLLVRAGYKPLGVAQTTREVADAMGAADMGKAIEEVNVKDTRKSYSSIMDNHDHMLTRVRDPKSTSYHMANWPIELISRRKPFTDSAFERHARMADFPIGLISKRKPYTVSIFSRHARMANFPMGLISKRKPFTGSIFSRHARMANFPIRLLSKRKPFTGTIIGRHTRMAGWPFPHLINGKQGANALVPGGARMANFPIRLLSGRKPFTGSIFSRHARMAKFPFGLLSKRKPFTGSVLPRHARMANFPLPLLIKDGGDGRGFLVTRMFGLSPLAER